MNAQGFRLRLDVRGSLSGLEVYRCYKRGYQDLVRAVCTSTRYEGVQGFLKFICGEEHKISDPYEKDPSIGILYSGPVFAGADIKFQVTLKRGLAEFLEVIAGYILNPTPTSKNHSYDLHIACNSRKLRNSRASRRAAGVRRSMPASCAQRRVPV